MPTRRPEPLSESSLTTLAVVARCPLCFSRQSRIVERFAPDDANAPWRVVACDDCGMMFTNPRPPSNAWDSYYPPAYGPHRSQRQVRQRSYWRDRLACWWFERQKAASRLSFGALAAIVGSWFAKPGILPPTGSGRLLDFGCGAGDYLARMRALGWQVTGLERSVTAATRAVAAHDVHVVLGTLPNTAFESQSFDLITAWEVLEHLERPRQALAACRELLKPDGRLILTVPNQDGWAARRFGPDWLGLDLPRHLVHFSKRTLTQMLLEEQFEIVALATIGHPSWIRRSAIAATTSGDMTPRLFRSRLVSGMASRLACHCNRAESIYVVARPNKSDRYGCQMVAEI